MTTVRATAVLTLATAAALAGAASSASATTIVGFGNSATNNSCANQGGAAASGATTQGPGTASGLLASLPMGGPANQCGNLGLPTQVPRGFLVAPVATPAQA